MRTRGITGSVNEGFDKSPPRTRLAAAKTPLTVPTTDPTLLLELKQKVPDVGDPEPDPDVEEDVEGPEVMEVCGVEERTCPGQNLKIASE